VHKSTTGIQWRRKRREFHGIRSCIIMTPTQNSSDTILLVRDHDGKKKKAPYPPRMWTMYGTVPKKHNFQKSHLEKDDSHPKNTTAIMVFDILCGEAPPSLSSPDPALRNPAQGHRYVF